jgi:hypothetical protein
MQSVVFKLLDDFSQMLNNIALLRNIFVLNYSISLFVHNFVLCRLGVKYIEFFLMTSVDFEVIRSKIKVKMTLYYILVRSVTLQIRNNQLTSRFAKLKKNVSKWPTDDPYVLVTMCNQ